MNSEEYDKLSDEEKRIKVAEFDGWTEAKAYPPETWAGQRVIYVIGTSPVGMNGQLVPDYLNDLNVCHEFEKVLTVVQAIQYDRRLQFLCDVDGDYFWNATAAQRCKAFCITMEAE